ncbi:MAG: hypothetical protein OXH83_09460 [Bryobacterales bacterium]|nr:hypothetical protein [Bryobacterales bacterium]
MTSRRRALAGLALAAVALPAQSAVREVSPLEAIGWKLFFDPLLSKPRNTSCASCHIPEKGFESGVALGEGAYGDILPRNTPTVVNLADAEFFFWDGRAGSLEEQAKGPIENPIEMDLAHDEAARRVRDEAAYAKAFGQAGIDDITIDAITQAIAAFERGLATGPTLFDKWLEGDRTVFNEAQERGRMIFFTRGQCATCHFGPNFTDGWFHNIGTGTADDPGRSNISNDDYDIGAFKTPALRNWKGREPFMHDGRFETLDDVLSFYNEPKTDALGQTELDPLDLSKQDHSDIKAFLETLNGAWPDLAAYEAAWQALQ